MKKHLLTVALLGSMSCEEGGPAFQPLGELCRERAEALCEALSACCQEPPASLLDCQKAETARCDQERNALEAEGQRSYDSRHGSRVLNAQRDALRSCGELGPVAAYYGGGLADGESCQGHAQCASGQCSADSQLCTAAGTPVAELCTGAGD